MVKRGTMCLGFTLVEILVVLMLSAMLITATLAVYHRVRGVSQVIGERMGEHRLTGEILQKIAEDIDRLAAPGFEATMTFRNKAVRGAGDYSIQSAELILSNSYYGNNDKKEVYDEIVWRSVYDPGEETMILYRKHSGLNGEDRLFDRFVGTDAAPETLDESRERFIPVAAGVTYFDLRVQQGEQVLSSWNSEKLPKAVRIGLSFAPPQALEDGRFDVADADIVYRTVAVDRMREIPYEFVKVEMDLGMLDDETADDPNSVSMDAETDGELPDLPVLEPDSEDLN